MALMAFRVSPAQTVESIRAKSSRVALARGSAPVSMPSSSMTRMAGRYQSSPTVGSERAMPPCFSWMRAHTVASSAMVSPPPGWKPSPVPFISPASTQTLTLS